MSNWWDNLLVVDEAPAKGGGAAVAGGKWWDKLLVDEDDSQQASGPAVPPMQPPAMDELAPVMPAGDIPQQPARPPQPVAPPDAPAGPSQYVTELMLGLKEQGRMKAYMKELRELDEKEEATENELRNKYQNMVQQQTVRHTAEDELPTVPPPVVRLTDVRRASKLANSESVWIKQLMEDGGPYENLNAKRREVFVKSLREYAQRKESLQELLGKLPDTPPSDEVASLRAQDIQGNLDKMNEIDGRLTEYLKPARVQTHFYQMAYQAALSDEDHLSWFRRANQIGEREFGETITEEKWKELWKQANVEAARTGGKGLEGLGKMGQRRARDAAQGVVLAAQGFIGLLDAATFLVQAPYNAIKGEGFQTGLIGQAVDRGLEKAGGLDLATSQEVLGAMQTPREHKGRESFAETEGLLEKVGVLAKHPNLVASEVTKSIPMMLGGAGIGRTLVKTIGLSPRVAAAIGEGMVVGGAMAENVRSQMDDGLIGLEQTALSAGAGVTTGLFSLLGSRIAGKLGITDIDVVFVSGLPKEARGHVVRKIIGGAVVEGFVEELPQEVTEQILQNRALGRPWDEGLADAAVMATATGAAMGGGINVLSAGGEKLRAIRSAEPQNLKRLAAEIGITGSRKEVRKKLDAAIQQAEQETQDAEAIRGPEEKVREAEGGEDLRGVGQGQVGPEPTREVAPAPEVQVEEKKPSVIHLPDETRPVPTEEPAPPTEPPRTGQYVQWTSHGQDQLNKPKRVTKVSNDGQFVFVEGNNTGIPIAETQAVDEDTQHEMELVASAQQEVAEWKRSTRRRGGRVADVTLGGLQKAVNSALKLLGLKATDDLSPEGIKAAYRRSVKTAHPDAGGSTAKIQAVNRARELLEASPTTLELAKRKRERQPPPEAPQAPEATGVRIPVEMQQSIEAAQDRGISFDKWSRGTPEGRVARKQHGNIQEAWEHIAGQRTAPAAPGTPPAAPQPKQAPKPVSEPGAAPQAAPKTTEAAQEPESAQEAQPATERMTTGDVVQVPTEDINVDPSRFQFKTGISKKTGVVEGEELQGEWDPLAGGVILVWEDKAGKLWAVNGHHRLDLAKRENVPSMTARIVRQQDGVTESDARAMGAKLNILEGQGKVEDYADFFRATKISEAEARRQGLLARAKGETGFMVGRFASEDVWAGFRAGKVSAEKAASISDVGRGDEGLQVAGLQAAQKKSADELRHFLRALKQFGPKPKERQGDLFGFDDSAIRDAEQISKAVADITSALKDRLLAVQGALRRPETAKKMGLTGDFESIEAEAKRIREELERWDKWTTDSDLVREARVKAGLEQPTEGQKNIFGEVEEPKPKPQEVESEAGKQGSLFAKEGLPGQKNLFPDKGVPDDMVAEPVSGETAAEEAKTKLQQAAERASQEAVDELDAFGKMLKGKGLGANLFLDPEVVAGAAKLTAKFAKAGTLKFAAFLEQVAKTIGQAATNRIRPVLEAEWEKFRQTGEAEGMEAVQPQPEVTTGTKHAKTEELRAKRGLPERVPTEKETFEEWEEQARRDYPDAESRLRLVEIGEQHPERVGKVENAAIGQHIADLENRRAAGEDVLDELLRTVKVWDAVGSEAGRALASRKAERYADFSLAAIISEHNETVGEDPTAEQMKEYAEQADRIKELESRNDELQKKLAEEEVKRRLAEAKVARRQKPSPEKKGTKRARLQKQASEAVAGFKEAWAALSQMGAISDPKQRADKWVKITKAAGKVIESYVALGVDSLLEVMSRVTAEMGKLNPNQVDAFKEAWESRPKDTRAEPLDFDPNDAEALRTLADQLTRWAVESGIEEYEAVVDAVHAEMQQAIPGITRTQTRDAISQYGVLGRLSTKDIDVKVRAIKGKIRQTRKIEDIQNAITQSQKWLDEGMAPDEVARRLRDQNLLPKASGREHATPDSIERALIAEYNKFKKDLPVSAESREGQLKSALSTAKTAGRNRLEVLGKDVEALKEAIAKRERLAKPIDGRPLLKPDAELTALRDQLAEKSEQRDQLKSEYEKIFQPAKKPGRKQLTDAQRLAMAEKMLGRQIEAVKAETKALKEGRWTPKGTKPAPTSDAKAKLQQELDRLQEIRDQARKASPAYQAREDAKRIARYKKSQQRQLAFWEKRRDEAAKGKLPAKRKPTPVDNEILDNKLKIEKVQYEAMVAMEKAKRAKWNAGQWIGHGLLETTSFIPKSLMLGLEWSFFKRQGFFYARSHPIRAFVAAVNAIQASFSARIALAATENIENRPDAHEYHQGGVEFTRPAGPKNRLEEMYQSGVLRWLEETKHLLWLPLRTWAKLYSIMERGNRSFANTMKADMYDISKRDTLAARAFFEEHGGEHKPWLEEDIKRTGRTSNIFSGRGTGLKGGNPWLDFFFLARRWAWSRIQADFIVPFQLLTPKQIGQWNADRGMRVSMAKLYIQTLMGHATKMAITYWIYMLAAGDDEEKKPTVELDLRSSDAWKLKMGETRVADEGGVMPALVLAARVLTGEMKTSKGEIKSIYGEDVQYGGQTAADFIVNYGKYKMGTGPSAILEWASGRDVVGNVVSPTDVVVKRVTPLTWREIVDAERELGVKQGTLAGLEAFFGASVSTYGPRTEYRKATPAKRKEQFAKDLKAMKWDTPSPAYSEFLSSDQLELVEDRKDEKREEVVKVAAASHDPKNKTYEDQLKTRTAARDALQEMGISHDEAQELLVESFWRPGNDGKPGSEKGDDGVKTAYTDRGKVLATLYGLPESAYQKWRTPWLDTERAKKYAEYKKRQAKLEPLKAPYGRRESGAPKGKGFLGELKLPGGGVTTEYTVGVKIDGDEMEIPTLVPTLTDSERRLMVNDIIPNGKKLSDSIKRGKKLPDSIKRKAVAHARKRLEQGESVFAD